MTARMTGTLVIVAGVMLGVASGNSALIPVCVIMGLIVFAMGGRRP